MPNGPRTHQKATDSLTELQKWRTDRRRLGDWDNYRQNAGSGLNKTKIAAECRFLPRAFGQNPALKAEFESILAEVQIVKATDAASSARQSHATSSDKQEIKRLSEQVAALAAENFTLKQRLKQVEHIDLVLQATGRLVKP